MMKTKIGWMIVAGLLAGSVGGAEDVHILIDDAGFESQTVYGTTVQAAHAANTTEWNSTDAANPWFRTTGLPGYSGSILACGAKTAFQHLTGNTYVEGKTYTLKAWFGNTNTGSSNTGTIRFTDATGGNDAGGTILASQVTPLTAYNGDGTYDDWDEVTLVYTATAADAGKTIGIALISQNYVYADNVSLTVSPGPVDDADFESQTVYGTTVQAAYTANTTEWNSTDAANPWFRTTGLPGHSGGILACGSKTAFQHLEETYVEGRTYTLKAWFGNTSTGSSNTGTIRFTDATGGNDAGGTILASQVTPLTAYNGDGTYDDWDEVTLVYTATAADAGKPIGIALFSQNYVYADNVSLTMNPFVFSRSGQTEYKIVVSAHASEAIEYAAEELAYFLGEMTGATFATVTDETLVGAHEIVLGSTSRFSMNQIPNELKPTVAEGFILFRESEKLIILGNTDRAVLYGVYDFLELELGCRFLDKDTNHIPGKPELKVDFAARKYDPPFEYRDLCTKISPYDVWAVRSRLNSVWAIIPMEKKIGGVKFVGPRFCHTFAYLVPEETYYDSHPEYYALVDGERLAGGTWKTLFQPAQLCLTHPDVLQITIDTVKQWIEEYENSYHYNENTLLVASVSVNDSPAYCECSECAVINEEEESPGGTLYRFVNAVADGIVEDYPEVRVDTLAYGPAVIPPKITVPHSNVIIRFTPHAADDARAFDDPESARNRDVFNALSDWAMITDNLYVWNYYLADHSAIKPFPNFKPIDKNIRMFRDFGVKGFFAEATHCSKGSELRELRNYLLARCIWRPETNAEEVIPEFCTLYYGEAATPYILEYIDFVYDTFLEQDIPLVFSGERMEYTDSFLNKADSILAEAEAAAESVEEKQRVANARLALWYRIILRAFESDGHVVSMPLIWDFKVDPEDIGIRDSWAADTVHEGWDAIRIDEPWTKQGHNSHGAAWYSIEFDLPGTRSLDTLALLFRGVNGNCKVFLDGELVGEESRPPVLMWGRPFFIPIEKMVPPGEHVLTLRVEKDVGDAGIWRPVSLVDRSHALQESVTNVCSRFVEVSESLGMTQLGSAGSLNQLEEEFYPQINALLNRTPSEPPLVPSTVRKRAVFMSNTHKTFERTTDNEGTLCVIQKADSDWTFGQAIQWYATEALKRAGAGVQHRLRVRVKVDKKGDAGLAFKYGSSYYNKGGESGNYYSKVEVRAEDVENLKWAWYELPTPVPSYDPDVEHQVCFVVAGNNPDQINAIYVDRFELVSVPLAGDVGAQDVLIAIDDADFESQTVYGIDVYDAYIAGTTEWDSTDTDNPWFRTSGLPGHNGGKILACGAKTAFQHLTGNTYLEGRTYTLTAWFLNTDAGASDTGTLRFTDATGGNDAGGTVLASQATTLSAYSGDGTEYGIEHWDRVTLVYTATATDAGKTIGIAMVSQHYNYADNVSLTMNSDSATSGLLFVVIGL